MRPRSNTTCERLTPIEFVVLGLVAEQPRHGYDVEAAIAARRLREWTPIGFSSIYHVLNKLERCGLLADQSRARGGLTQRVYRVTEAGRQRLQEHLRRVVGNPSRVGHEIELAMMFAGFLGRDELAACLSERAARAAAGLREEKRLRRHYRAHGSVWTDLIFRHTIGYMSAELAWTRAALAELKADDNPQGGTECEKECSSGP